MAEWQKGTGWKEWFEITGADGVDFHPISQDPRKNPAIVLQSNTKEDILERKVCYPKSGYSFWKKINGKKYYVSLESPIERIHKLNVTAEAEYVIGHLRGGYYNGDLELSEEDYRIFQKDPLAFLLMHQDLWEDWSFKVDDYEIDDIGKVWQVDFYRSKLTNQKSKGSIFLEPFDFFINIYYNIYRKLRKEVMKYGH